MLADLLSAAAILSSERPRLRRCLSATATAGENLGGETSSMAVKVFSTGHFTSRCGRRHETVPCGDFWTKGWPLLKIF